jgi:predicted nucleotidyltransferase
MPKSYSKNKGTAGMDKVEVIDKLKEYKILLLKYFDVDKIYLFGSFARGTNNQDSDIDVAVVVNNMKYDYLTASPMLWKLRRNIDLRIEPLLFEKNLDSSGFLDEIKRYGIEI